MGKQHHDPMFEYGRKFGFFLETEGLLRCTEGAELIEQKEISESDHRWFLIGAGMAFLKN